MYICDKVLAVLKPLCQLTTCASDGRRQAFIITVRKEDNTEMHRTLTKYVYLDFDIKYVAMSRLNLILTVMQRMQQVSPWKRYRLRMRTRCIVTVSSFLRYVAIGSCIDSSSIYCLYGSCACGMEMSFQSDKKRNIAMAI